MKTTFILLLSMVTLGLAAQEFTPGFDRFSKKKPAYVTTMSGEEVSGLIDNISRKKGNIAEIKIEVNKKLVTFKPEQIKFMYLPATELNMMAVKWEAGTNVSKDMDMEKVKDGYAFFENTEVNLKGKKQILMMQLVNPGFNDKIKVYFDPYAQESASMSMGGGLLKVGGLDKSYFVKKGNAAAEKFTKKEYDENYKSLYAGCASLLKKLDTKLEWSGFANHVWEYQRCE